MREYHYQPRLTGEALQAAKDNGTPYYPSARWGTGRVETRESVTRNASRIARELEASGVVITRRR